MQRIKAFLRKEMVLVISLGAALLSMLLIAPDRQYLGYVDWDVLMLLFSLMAVVAGLKSGGVFARVSRALVRKAGNLQRLTMLLSLCCFFFSMLVTNDVALLTFVPLTLAMLAGQKDRLIYAVTLETIAANLGSMATPIGNPQNLYLYAHYNMDTGAFCQAVLPLAAVSLALVLLACLPIPKSRLEGMAQQENVGEQQVKGDIALARPWLLNLLYALQFLCCLLAVFNVIPKAACFGAVLLTMLVMNRVALSKVDYALLGTFLCFFVFVGNLGRLDAVRGFLTAAIAGRELETGILTSQIISNVPAALMLSGFTTDAAQLMRGVDLGGLGTLVASLASLISFKLYMGTEGARGGRFLAIFTGINVLFLAVLYGVSFVL